MLSEDKLIIMRVIERYIRTGNIEDEQVKVTCLSENKTSAIERVGDDSRSIMLDEYKVDGTSIWAGYSGKSRMVFLSPVKHY